MSNFLLNFVMSCIRAVRCFSTRPSSSSSSPAVSAAGRRKWGIGGLPSPKSILNDDSIPVDLSEDNDAVNGVRPNTPPRHLRRPPAKPTPNEWKSHRVALKSTFPEGWSPPRKLSREAMDGLRDMHKLNPAKFSTPILADRFKISPEAVRRILKSKWEPPQEKRVKWAMQARQHRNEKGEYMRQTLLKEMREANDILSAKQYRGDLTLKG